MSNAGGSTGGRLRSDAAWAGVLLVFRLVLAVAAGVASGWGEYSDDVSFQLTFINDPLALLLGQDVAEDAGYLPPFPPLLPIVLWLFSTPTLTLIGGAAGAFLATRITFAVFEAAALWLTRVAMRSAGRSPRAVQFGSALWLVAPIGWMTSSVMSQQEALAAAFAALVCALVASRRFGLALLACGVATVAAKVYFLVPIAGLIVIGPWGVRAVAWRALLAFGPIVLAYSLAATQWASAGRIGLASFTPQVEPSINAWGLVPMIHDVGDETLKRVSAIVALLLGLLPAVVWKLRARREGRAADGPEALRVLVAQFLWVFASFYLVSPEYLLLAVPGLLVVLRTRASIAVVGVLLTIPWATNFAYGVRVAIERAGDEPVQGAKAAFVKIWNTVSPIGPEAGQVIGIVAFMIGLAGLAALLTRSKDQHAQPGAQKTPRP